MDVFLLRHGDCSYDEVKRYVGQGDYPLNERGKQQARSWQHFFVQHPPARVVSSNLTRAIQTAHIVLEQVAIPVEEEPALREVCLGEWEGASMERIKHYFPGEYAARGQDLAGFRPPGGESFTDLWNRVVPCFTALTAQAHEERPLLLVTHAGVIRILLCHVLGMDVQRMFSLGVDYARMVHFQRQKNDQNGWIVKLMNGGPAGY